MYIVTNGLKLCCVVRSSSLRFADVKRSKFIYCKIELRNVVICVFLIYKNEIEYCFTANQPLLSHFGTSRRVHFSAHPPSISIFIPLRTMIAINPPHCHAALRSQFSMSTSIIIRLVHLSFTRPKALLKIKIKVTEGKIRITIRIRPIRKPPLLRTNIPVECIAPPGPCPS